LQASLCGHYEVVQLLLESGALCERDTFQGERCLYNALNDRIRNLLLEYDYSKSTDPLQPLAAHITSILSREHPKTTDLTLFTDEGSINVHKFILAARSPYFRRKLQESPSVTQWRLPNSLSLSAIWTVLRFIYLSEISLDSRDAEEETRILTEIEKFSRLIEMERLFDITLERDDRRLTRQRMQDEVERGRDELLSFFRENVLKNKVIIDTSKADRVKWDRNNFVFADVLLTADHSIEDTSEPRSHQSRRLSPSQSREQSRDRLPIGPFGSRSRSVSPAPVRQTSVLFPVHRAMLLRSEYFLTMFSSGFKESQEQDYLHVIQVDCSPEVLEVILAFMYSETADFPLDVAIEVLFVADQLFIEKLKVKAAVTISSLGAGLSVVEADNSRGETDDTELLDIYDVIRAGWATRVHRLEEFGARYLANRLEKHIDREEFSVLVKESAERIKERQETDTVELVDDIRYYLSERFRLRFEDAGLEDILDEEEAERATANGEHAGEGHQSDQPGQLEGFMGVVRNPDGEEVDEFEEDAKNYTSLLAKIEGLLEKLNLDA
jgi:ankyrin repeat/BTB/POZ domain-containing protein 1